MCVCVCVLCRFSGVWLCGPWTVAHQPPLSMGFCRGILQARTEQWAALTSSRAPSRPRERTLVSVSPALAGGSFTVSSTWEALSDKSVSYDILLVPSQSSYLFSGRVEKTTWLFFCSFFLGECISYCKLGVVVSGKNGVMEVAPPGAGRKEEHGLEKLLNSS